MKKLTELYAKFRSSPRWQQEAAIAVASFIAGMLLGIWIAT